MSLIADSFLEALTCAQFIRQLVDCYYVIGVHHRKPAMIYVLYLAAQQLLYNVVVVLSLSLSVPACLFRMICAVNVRQGE
jgi:hypothetical protein